MKDILVAKGFSKNWGYLLLGAGMVTVFGWFKSLFKKLLNKDCFGESFEFNVVSCCGLTKVEKSAHFGHLKSFLKEYKFSSFINNQFKEKK